MVVREFKNGELYLNGKKVLKVWESFNGWYWFATEPIQIQDSEIGGRIYHNDQIWYGFVQGLESEWGDFSEAELNAQSPRVWVVPKRNYLHVGRSEDWEKPEYQKKNLKKVIPVIQYEKKSGVRVRKHRRRKMVKK